MSGRCFWSCLFPLSCHTHTNTHALALHACTALSLSLSFSQSFHNCTQFYTSCCFCAPPRNKAKSRGLSVLAFCCRIHTKVENVPWLILLYTAFKLYFILFLLCRSEDNLISKSRLGSKIIFFVKNVFLHLITLCFLSVLPVSPCSPSFFSLSFFSVIPLSPFSWWLSSCRVERNWSTTGPAQLPDPK